MPNYAGPAIIGILVSFILGFFITPFISVIFGGFIGRILCKGGPSGGSRVGILMGIVYSIPIYIIASLLISQIPFIGVIIGAIGIGTMLIIGVLDLIGGVIGGLLSSKS